jgi:MFS family permease
MIYVPTIAVISHWFQRRRALAMGIATSGFSIGATLHPIMLNNLFHGSAGFATGVRASAGLFAGCMLVGALLMRSRLPPVKLDTSLSVLLARFARDLPYVGLCLAYVLSFLSKLG